MKYLVLFLISINIFAGFEKGNGGDAVVCGEDVKLFDYYEAKARGLDLDLGYEEYRVEDKLRFLFERLEKILPYKAYKYQEWAYTFFDEAHIAPIELVDVKDSDHVFIPPLCELKQLVVQREPKFKEDKRYYIDQRLWDKMNKDQKAITILHELIYRDAIENGQKNSINSRYLNSYLFSNKISTLDNFEIYQFLKDINFLNHSMVKIGELIFSGEELEIYPNGQIKRGEVPFGDTLDLLEVQIEGKVFCLPSGKTFEFYENGLFKSIYSEFDLAAPSPCRLDKLEKSGKVYHGIKSVTVFESGSIKELRLNVFKAEENVIKIQDKQFYVQTEGEVIRPLSFYETGEIKEVAIHGVEGGIFDPVKLESKDGKLIEIDSWSFVKLTKDEKVISIIKF